VHVRDDEEDDELDEFAEEEELVNLGPDERDRDLMDGTWEAEHYSGRQKTRDWNTISAGVALIVLMALIVPMFLVLFD
jgi:hypothetical protein